MLSVTEITSSLSASLLRNSAEFHQPLICRGKEIRFSELDYNLRAAVDLLIVWICSPSLTPLLLRQRLHCSPSRRNFLFSFRISLGSRRSGLLLLPTLNGEDPCSSATKLMTELQVFKINVTLSQFFTFKQTSVTCLVSLLDLPLLF